MIFAFQLVVLSLTFRANALPLFKKAEPVSPCFLNCTEIALATGCDSVADLACICNNPPFQAVLVACVHQQCPEEDRATAQSLAPECVDHFTIKPSGLASIAVSSPSTTSSGLYSLTSSTSSISSPSPPSTTDSKAPFLTSFISHIPPTPSTVSSPSPMRVSSTPGSPYRSVNPNASASIPSSSSFPSDALNELRGISESGYSARTAIIIGSIIGSIVLIMLGFFVAWWYKNGRFNSASSIHKGKRISMVTAESPHTYRGEEAIVHPWSYDPVPTQCQPTTSSMPPLHPFIAIVSPPMSKPPLPDDRRHSWFDFLPFSRGEQESSFAGRYAQPVKIRNKKRGRISLGLPPAYEQPQNDLQRRPSSSEL